MRTATGALLALAVLSACSMGGVTPRSLSPNLDAADVERASNDRQRIMNALVLDAGYDAGTTSWYEVTLAGFNYVDDRCAEYFDSLFKFNRQVGATKSALTAFDKTTNAILSVTGAAQLTMTIVAQAFGLANNLTDIVAGTYLFELPPATTLKFVDETQHAYKDGAARVRNQISSPAAAYGYVRGYLNLCLPATIEGKLVDHISGAIAVADPGRTGANLEVRVGSDNAAFRRSELLRDAQASVTGAGQQGTGSGYNAYEKEVLPAHWRFVQQTLCIATDGDPGKATHEAIALFFEGYGTPKPIVLTEGIGPTEMAVLNQAVDEAQGRTCEQMGYEDAREVGLALG